MGKPGCQRWQSLRRKPEGKPGELKHLSTLWKEKSTEMPEVAASETGRAQTEVLVAAGL
jgi:hypothetical protein